MNVSAGFCTTKLMSVWKETAAFLVISGFCLGINSTLSFQLGRVCNCPNFIVHSVGI